MLLQLVKDLWPFLHLTWNRCAMVVENKTGKRYNGHHLNPIVLNLLDDRATHYIIWRTGCDQIMSFDVTWRNFVCPCYSNYPKAATYYFKVTYLYIIVETKQMCIFFISFQSRFKCNLLRMAIQLRSYIFICRWYPILNKKIIKRCNIDSIDMYPCYYHW